MAFAARPLPAKWGGDSLTAYLDTFQTNTCATFQKKPEEFARLRDIDALFLRIAEQLLNPKDQLGALLLLRSHAGYRAACALVMAGSCAESFVVARSCLETAAYALYINKDPKYPFIRDVWMNRGDGPDQLKACRKEFQYGKYIETLKAVDAKLAEIFSTLYERAIDFGAHPNEAALASNLMMEKEPGLTKMLQIYLHGNGMHLDHALKTTAQVGVCALRLFGHIFLERYKLLGLFEQLPHLEEGL